MSTFPIKGTTFDSKQSMKASILHATNASSKTFRIVVNRDHRYLVCCASHNAGKGWRKNPFVCPWSVECKPTSTHEGMWKIIIIVSNHTSSDDGSNRKRNHHRNSLEDASQVLQPYIPSRKSCGASHQLTIMVKATDGFDLKKGQAHSIVQEKSQNGIHVHIGQYLLLPSYLDWLNDIDPDGNLVLETQACSWENKEQFKRLYISFSYIQKIWCKGGCLPLCANDGRFTTSGKFQHTILIAASYDANKNLVMLAHAIVDKENEDNW